jgi:hypothetical protein
MFAQPFRPGPINLAMWQRLLSPQAGLPRLIHPSQPGMVAPRFLPGAPTIPLPQATDLAPFRNGGGKIAPMQEPTLTPGYPQVPGQTGLADQFTPMAGGAPTLLGGGDAGATGLLNWGYM